ncbi:putative surface layer protein [Oscillibacter valericigenes Sjm18-20]|nr:putative surface layer protein [Oscillibacter valericigenes Sjm18-20]
MLNLKKRLSGLILAVALATALCVPAAAAENSTDNFIRGKTYTGEFSDVAAGTTFYDNVSALYEYGLSIGKSDGTFGLRDSVTVGQIVIFAGRIRSLYATGDAESGAAGFRQEGQAAYEPYLAYLQSGGVLAAELNGLYRFPATRAQVAHVLAVTLPSDALPLVNDSLVTKAYASRQYITDVTEYTPYYDDILTLYKAGLSVGSDMSGNFGPNDAITRGAAAAMLTRMVDPALRITPAWTVTDTAAVSDYSAAGTSWGDLITADTTYSAAPTTQSQITSDVAYMLSRETNVLELDYGAAVSSRYVDSVMNAALSVVKSYCEQMYNSVECTYETQTGKVTLTFSAVAAGSSLPSYRDYTLNAAIAVHDKLWSEGAITADMTETEKARVYFKWICDNCVYDSSAGDDSISHIAYSLFRNGQAVCDGYSGAYNLLLKLEGIDCYALSNSDHIWTVATLDGTTCHIDTTWGDSTGSVDYRYFAMTEKQSWNYHPW